MRICGVIASAFLAAVLVGFGFAPAAQANILVVVDKSTQSMTVSVDGQWRWTWPVSTGIARYDTPNGQYTAFRMEAEHFSKEWDDAPMPHSVFFTMKGHAIHGSLHTKLGQPASHGCVRLSPENAASLYALVEQQGLPHTKVVIEGEIPSGVPVVAAREAPTPARLGFRLPWLETPRPQLRERQYVRERDTARQRQAARRVDPVMQAYAAPVYPAPRGYAAPRIRAASGVRFDPRVEVTEETYVNGVKVRRHYMRRATPADYYGWR